MINPDIDARDLQKCVHCGKGMMHAGAIHFYEVTVTQCVVDLESVRQLDGLERMMGAAAPLAHVFAPSTRAAIRVGEGTRTFVCSECAILKTASILEYTENGSD